MSDRWGQQQAFNPGGVCDITDATDTNMLAKVRPTVNSVCDVWGWWCVVCSVWCWCWWSGSWGGWGLKLTGVDSL